MFEKKIIVMFDDEYHGVLFDVRQNIVSDSLENIVAFLRKYFDDIKISNDGNFINCHKDGICYMGDIIECYELIK